MRKSYGGQCLPCLDQSASRALAANVKHQLHILRSGERGKEMVGLEYKSNMVAPQLGRLLGAEVDG